MPSPIMLALPGTYTTHGAFVPPLFPIPAVSFSSTVRVNGLFVHRAGDTSEIHCVPIIPPICDIEVFQGPGFATIFCEGRPLMRAGAVTAPGGCTGTMMSHTVLGGA